VVAAWLRANAGYQNGDNLDESVVPNINPTHISWPADGMHRKNDRALCLPPGDALDPPLPTLCCRFSLAPSLARSLIVTFFRRLLFDLAVSATQVHQYLMQGRPVIANVDSGRHFVLVTGWRTGDADTVLINDPYFNVTTYSISKDIVGWRLFNMTAVPHASPRLRGRVAPQ
jgi:hypothetical protein